MNFAKNLKELRLKKNLSQEELAKKLNLSKITVSKYEQGQREPNFTLLEKIKETLNCTYDDLLK